MGKKIKLTQKHALASKTLKTNREAGTLKDVSIITKGPALGHGFEIDDVFLRQVANSIEKQGGVKVRLQGKGPGHGSPGISERIGKASRARVKGNKVLADVKLGQYAKSSPGGNLWDFVFDLAEDDDAKGEVGFSIVYERGPYHNPQGDDGREQPAARLAHDEAVIAADIVDDPASNPGGFLSSKETEMDPLVRRYLQTIGLSADADETEAQEFLESLDGDRAEMAAVLAGNQPADADDGIVQAAQRVMKNERKRYRGLCGLAEKSHLGEDFVRKHYLAGRSVNDDVVREEALDNLGEVYKPLELDSRSGNRVSVGQNRNQTSLHDAIGDAILLRAGQRLYELDESGRPERDADGNLKKREADRRAKQLRGLPLLSMGRKFLEAAGVPGVDSMSASTVAKRLLSGRDQVALAQSTSDFPALLGDAMNKSVVGQYMERRPIWESWCSWRTVQDFKTIHAIEAGAVPDLVERSEGEEITYVTISESEETYALVEYANGVRLTRQAVINDDLAAFSRIPRDQATAARRLEDTVSLSVLIDNNALSDGENLFSAAHSNQQDSDDPSVSTLNNAFAAMRKQTREGEADSYLNLMPAVLLAPVELEGTVRELLTSKVRETGSSGATVDNIYQGELDWAVHPLLSANDTGMWYVVCAPDLGYSVEVAKLDGEQVPQTESERDFDSGDLKMKCTHVVAAGVQSYKGVWRDKNGYTP